MTCCVIPTELKEEGRIEHAYSLSRPLTCQFEVYLKEIYTFENKLFCALHIPFKGVEKVDKQSAFNKILSQGIKNFQFISICRFRIEGIEEKIDYLDFHGSKLWIFNISEINLDEIDFSYCKINGVNNVPYNCPSFFYSSSPSFNITS